MADAWTCDRIGQPTALARKRRTVDRRPRLASTRARDPLPVRRRRRGGHAAGRGTPRPGRADDDAPSSPTPSSRRRSASIRARRARSPTRCRPPSAAGTSGTAGSPGTRRTCSGSSGSRAFPDNRAERVAGDPRGRRAQRPGDRRAARDPRRRSDHRANGRQPCPASAIARFGPIAAATAGRPITPRARRSSAPASRAAATSRSSATCCPASTLTISTVTRNGPTALAEAARRHRRHRRGDVARPMREETAGKPTS